MYTLQRTELFKKVDTEPSDTIYGGVKYHPTTEYETLHEALDDMHKRANVMQLACFNQHYVYTDMDEPTNTYIIRQVPTPIDSINEARHMIRRALASAYVPVGYCNDQDVIMLISTSEGGTHYHSVQTCLRAIVRKHKIQHGERVISSAIRLNYKVQGLYADTERWFDVKVNLTHDDARKLASRLATSYRQSQDKYTEFRVLDHNGQEAN